MRVLVTPEWYPWPDRPFYGAFCREQALAVSRVTDVAVLTWRLDPALRVPFRLDVEDDQGLRTLRVRFGCGRVRKITAGFKLTGCLRALAHLGLRGWAPDIVHAHEYSASPVAFSVGLLARAPVIFTEHYSGFSTLSGRERRRAKSAFEHASIVCPVSRELTRHVREVAPRARLEPVPNVVDTDVFAPGVARRPGDPQRLITVGSLIERKGHRHLFAALARLRRLDMNPTLDVIGDGPLRSDLEALVAELGVADRVTFHGGTDKTAIAAALRRADVFVLPSLWENLPCVLLEAMSSGLPVVATDVGGVREVVEPDRGILVPPGSADALTEGLLQALSNIADFDRRRMRAHVVSTFGYVAVARRWEQIYAAAREAHASHRRAWPRRA